MKTYIRNHLEVGNGDDISQSQSVGQRTRDELLAAYSNTSEILRLYIIA